MLGSFAEDLSRTVSLIEMDGDVITYAIDGARQRGLRPGDAIQFGAAFLASKKSTGNDYVFVGSDKELLNAFARFVNVEVLNPEADGALERLKRLRTE